MAFTTRTTQGEGSNFALNPKTGQLFVCGPQEKIMVLDGATGEQLSQHEISGKPTCLAVTHKGDVASIGMESGKVEKNLLPEVDFDDFTARCTSAVRDVEYSKSDKWVAVASDDLELRVVDTEDHSQIKELRNEKDSCSTKSICFDPKEELLAQVGTNGDLTIWNLSTLAAIFSMKIMERDASKDQNKVARAAWKPDGSVLAVPGARSLRVLQRGSWKQTQVDSAQTEAHTKEITAVAWSPDGSYVATCAADKKVVIRDAVDYKAVQTSSVETETLNFVWTSNSTLAVMDVEGNVGILKVTATKRPQAEQSAPEKAPEATEAGSTNEKDSLSNKADQRDSQRSRLVDDEAGVRDDDDEDDGKGEKGDDDASGGEEEEAVVMEEDGPDGDGYEDEPASGSAAVSIQGPFLPSSSPLDATKRFLVWNLVGNIVSQSMEDHNVIEIEFMDASKRTVRFTDLYRFIMGSMSEDGAIFASASFAESDDPASSSLGTSAVFFRPFSTVHSHKKQWQMNLPVGEMALCVAIGQRWCAVATSRQFVRIFTTSGLQDDIITLSGPVVTMVGSRGWLAIFSHGGPPLNESQTISYQVLDLHRNTAICSGSLGITPKAILTWAGFSDAGVLCVMDSEGMVFGLFKSYGWQWSPIIDTAALNKNKLDSYWPVGVLDGKLMYTLLKGGEEAPCTAPKPIVSAAPLKIPIMITDQTFSRLEEAQLVAKGMLTHKAVMHQLLLEDGADPRVEAQSEADLIQAQAAYDTTLVKMIQAAAAAENPDRVLELADGLHLEKPFEIAIRVANHYSMPQVAAKISRMMAIRFPPLIDERRVLDNHHREEKALLSRQVNKNGDPDMEAEEDDQSEHQPSQAARERSSTQPAAANKRPSSSSSPPSTLPSPPVTSNAPANPFAVKSAAKQIEKRPRGIAESLSSLVGSPSPKRPLLNRTSTFVAEAREARSKKRHDKSV